MFSFTLPDSNIFHREKVVPKVGSESEIKKIV